MFSLRAFNHHLFLVNSKEAQKMAVIYVTLIIKGKRTFASVPNVIKPKVRELLADLELEELITE